MARQVARQNVGLSEKILQLKLAESRLTREAHMLNERVHFLSKVDEEREAATQRFEEEALRLRAEQEAQLEALAAKVPPPPGAPRRARGPLPKPGALPKGSDAEASGPCERGPISELRFPATGSDDRARGPYEGVRRRSPGPLRTRSNK